MSGDFLAVDIQPKIEAIIKELRKMGKNLERGGLMAGLRGGIKPVKAAIKRETPVVSGALRKSIGHRVVPKRDLNALQIASGAALFTGPTRKVMSTINGVTKLRKQDYKARFLEDGTDGHPITPKNSDSNRGALRYKGGMGFVFFNKIKHRGTPKNEFIKRAWNSSTGQYQQAFYKGLSNYLDKHRAA